MYKKFQNVVVNEKLDGDTKLYWSYFKVDSNATLIKKIFIASISIFIK